MKSRVLLFLFIFAAVISITSKGQAQPSGYHLLKKFVLGGDGGWDLLAVDSAAHRLYISRATHVMVVDTESGAIVEYLLDTYGKGRLKPAHGLGGSLGSFVDRSSLSCHIL